MARSVVESMKVVTIQTRHNRCPRGKDEEGCKGGEDIMSVPLLGRIVDWKHWMPERSLVRMGSRECTNPIDRPKPQTKRRGDVQRTQNTRRGRQKPMSDKQDRTGGGRARPTEMVWDEQKKRGKASTEEEEKNKSRG